MICALFILNVINMVVLLKKTRRFFHNVVDNGLVIIIIRFRDEELCNILE